MSFTNTPVAQLFKATAGTAEPWRVADVNNNWDKIDSALQKLSLSCCVLTKNNILSIPNAANTLISSYVSAPRNDSIAGNAMWSGGTSGSIVARKAGLYVAIGTILFANNSTGQRAAYLTKNNTVPDNNNMGVVSKMGTDAQLGVGTTPITVVGFDMLGVGDTIRLVTYQDSGAALNADGGTAGGKIKFGLFYFGTSLET